MEKLIDNIHIKRFFYFNLYVIKGKNGDILIDTGFVGMRKSLKRWLDQFNIKLVILTHAHVDHIWNASYIQKLYNCKIALGEMDIGNIDNTKINSKPSKKKYNVWTKLMNFGMKKFIPEQFNVDILLKDNQLINECGLNLKIISLSGHTTGSIGILYKDYLFAGDSLVNRGRGPEIAYQNQNNEMALESYKKIFELSPKIIFIGHDKEILSNKIIDKI